jgi:retinol dehydrogenase 12
MVTGSNTGVGKELARILHAKNAVVYVAARTESKALAAIQDIKAANPNSKGKLVFIRLDLGDLTTVKPAAEEFLAKETRLDVLFNNAGVMTTQGYELQLGTNNVGPFLLTKLLTPILTSTASTEPAGAVRVVWVASMAAELYSEKNGVNLANLQAGGYVKDPKFMEKYGNSKAGNYYHGTEYARRHKKDGIVSVVSGILHLTLMYPLTVRQIGVKPWEPRLRPIPTRRRRQRHGRNGTENFHQTHVVSRGKWSIYGALCRVFAASDAREERILE